MQEAQSTASEEQLLSDFQWSVVAVSKVETNGAVDVRVTHAPITRLYSEIVGKTIACALTKLEGCLTCVVRLSNSPQFSSRIVHSLSRSSNFSRHDPRGI